MMKSHKYAVLALALVLSAGCAQSKTLLRHEDYSAYLVSDADPLVLDTRNAMALALHENFTVLSAQTRVEGAKGRSQAAKAALGPYLALQGQGNAYDKIPLMPDNELIARVAVNQSIYSGGANQARSRQGKLGVKQAEQSLAETQEAVAMSVWNAFCEVLYRREVLNAQRDALDYYDKAEKELASRGRTSELDRTRVRQQKENALSQTIAAGNMLEVARIGLCRLLRLSPETRLALKGSLEDGLPTIEEASKLPDDPKAELDRILDRRNDYQALKTARDSQKQEITVAKAGMIPSLALSSGYRFGYHPSGLSDPHTEKRNQWGASLTLDVPVWDSGATRGRVRAAKAGLEAAEHAVAEKEVDVKAEVTNSWLSLQNAIASLTAARANVERSRESLKYAEEGYRKGSNTQLDVLQTRSDLTNALQQQATALNAARAAQAALWKAEGHFIEQASRVVPSETVANLNPPNPKERK